jgi:type VII secretion protein EccE
MPRFTLAQFVLLELAAAAVLGGWAASNLGLVVGAVVGVVLLALGALPVRRRWLYQVAISWAGMVRRRRRSSRSANGLAGLLGDYTVESVQGAGGRGRMGVVHSGTTWSLCLIVGLDAVFNDDFPVPIKLLADLLEVEDVPLSTVRLLTMTAPARTPASSPRGPAPALAPLVARYVLITLDTRRAADAIAARGGGEPAIHQILRRCAVRAEQVLATGGLTARRPDERAVESLFSTWLGPAVVQGSRRDDQTLESADSVRVAGTWSTIFAVTGAGPDIADRVTKLVAAAPTPVATTSLVLRPGRRRDRVEATMLVRLSAPVTAPRQDAVESLALVARAFDLELQRLDCEQGELLRATTPIGLGERT